jgi:hypothetical protein
MFPSVGLREPQHCGSGQRISLWERRIVTHKSVRESEHRSVEVRASGSLNIGASRSERRVRASVQKHPRVGTSERRVSGTGGSVRVLTCGSLQHRRVGRRASVCRECQSVRSKHQSKSIRESERPSVVFQGLVGVSRVITCGR